jgi:hypothetical protein
MLESMYSPFEREAMNVKWRSMDEDGERGTSPSSASPVDLLMTSAEVRDGAVSSPGSSFGPACPRLDEIGRSRPTVEGKQLEVVGAVCFS